MKFTPVNEIPRRRGNNRLQQLIEKFAQSEHQTVKLEFAEGEYKSISVARSVIANAIKRSHRPVILVKRGDELYLVKIQ